MFPPKGAIALRKFFKLNRLIKLTIITRIHIFIASNLHQLLIGPKFLKHLRALFLIAEVFPESKAYTLPHIIVMLGVEVVFVLDGAAERMLHRITIW